MKDPYKNVSCDFYDSLEIFATYHTPLLILYVDENGNEISIETIIKTLITKDKSEYLLTHNDVLIRLDKIILIAES